MLYTMSNSSSKRNQIGSESVIVQIDASNARTEANNSNPPRILSFPVGVPPNADEMQLQLLHKSDKDKKRKRMVTTAIDGLVYSGCDFGEYDTANNTVQFAVGTLDETTGIMKIIPADHAFIMRPSLEKNQVSAPPRLSSLSTAERREIRTDEFGSRKKKRAQQVAASNTISAQNISGAHAVETTLANSINLDEAHVDTTEKAIADNRSLYLPAYSLEATDVKDIYPLSAMLPEYLVAALEKCADDTLDMLKGELENPAMSWVKNGSVASSKSSKKSRAIDLADALLMHMQTRQNASESVLRCIIKVKDRLGHDADSVDDDEKHRRKLLRRSTRRVILFHFMMRFYVAITSSASKFKPDVFKEDISRLMSAPDPVSQYLFAAFTSPTTSQSKVSFSKLENDKLKIHLIAVALHINDFSCSVSVIARDLKLVDKVMADLARQMGCKVVKDKESKEVVVSLSAPLIFPTIKKGPAKK